jgi:hypothetical protein
MCHWQITLRAPVHTVVLVNRFMLIPHSQAALAPAASTTAIGFFISGGSMTKAWQTHSALRNSGLATMMLSI